MTELKVYCYTKQTHLSLSIMFYVLFYFPNRVTLGLCRIFVHCLKLCHCDCINKKSEWPKTRQERKGRNSKQEKFRQLESACKSDASEVRNRSGIQKGRQVYIRRQAI